jgi:hypothetical protein
MFNVPSYTKSDACTVKNVITSNVWHPSSNVWQGQKVKKKKKTTSFTNPNTLLRLIKAYLTLINGWGITFLPPYKISSSKF